MVQTQTTVGGRKEGQMNAAARWLLQDGGDLTQHHFLAHFRFDNVLEYLDEQVALIKVR